ncbi:MAG: fibronectin type III domain-containing protein [Planctomycetaceae bacterium]|nr:fibronectin type III domain-containing protein [Planctomycetaceae bacterium]
MNTSGRTVDHIASSRGLLTVVLAVMWIGLTSARSTLADLAPPAEVLVTDHPWDGGGALDVRFDRSPDDRPESADNPVAGYVVEQAGEAVGVYREVANLLPATNDNGFGQLEVTIHDVIPGEPYWYRVVAVGHEGERSSPAMSSVDAPGIATRQFFDGTRFWLLVIGGMICGSVVAFIALARAGKKLYIRKIAGLEAVEEAVGRATEMGRSCLFVPGVQDINDIQTIAGLTILSRVAQRAAEYDASLEVPTSRSLVMTAARETVQAAYLTAGRPDAYNEDAISYVTDEQFGYVAYLTGAMVREKPAACFYLGAFFAESLILAETGNAIGAIQVAGTAQPAQLPFFVAACDYTLIGEEFFAASAYLSHDPDQLGSLKGQDVGKLIVAGLMIVGVSLLTFAAVTGNDLALRTAEYVRNTILASG